MIGRFEKNRQENKQGGILGGVDMNESGTPIVLESFFFLSSYFIF